MAESQTFDQINAANTAARRPAFVNAYDTAQPVVAPRVGKRPAFVNAYGPAAENTPGPMARGFKNALQGVKSAGGGLLATAGATAGLKPVEQYGLDVASRANEEAAKMSMAVEDVNSVSSAADYAKYGVGQLGGNLLTMLAGGGLGRAGGSMLARGVPAAAEKLLLKNAGMVAGAVATNVGQEIGSIYPDAVANGVPDAVARTVLGGLAAGAVETVPEALLANKLGLFGGASRTAKKSLGGVLKSVGKGALVGAGIEGATEVAQSAIELKAAGSPTTGDAAFSNYLNSAALGAIGGFLAGGAGGGMHAISSRAQTPAPTPQVAPAPAPQVSEPLPTEAFAPPPTPFQAFNAENAQVIQEPDRMGLLDTIPNPVASPKSSLVRPTIIGQQEQVPIEAQPLILPGDLNAVNQEQFQGSVQQERSGGAPLQQAIGTSVSDSLRRATQVEEAPNPVRAESIQTQQAVVKQAAGQLLSTEEAVAVRKFQAKQAEIAARPVIQPVTSGTRGTVKQPSGRTARDNFVNAYTAAVDKVVADIKLPEAKMTSMKSALKAAAERAVKQPTAEKAQEVLNTGFAAALKGKLAPQDVERFTQDLTNEVAANAPPIVQKRFSQAAKAPSNTVVFSHWGARNGVMDPAKMGTGVKGADWAPAQAVGLQYASAVVRGSNYNEPAVQAGRTEKLGVLNADRVYQATGNDPLLAQARAEIAPQYGNDNAIALMQYAKKVRDLGYDAIQYPGGQLRVFKPQAVFEVPSKAAYAKVSAAAIQSHAATGGSTHNVVTGQDMGGTKNYAVNPYKEREVAVPGRNLDAATLRRYMEANTDLLNDPRNALGTWYNEKDGNSYMDVAVVMPSMQDAIAYANANNQTAIFDLRTFTMIEMDHPVFASAQQYVNSIGLLPVHEVPYMHVDPALSTEIAKAYDALQPLNQDVATTQAYTAFAQDVEAQFAAASAIIKIEPWNGVGEPYANSAEMRADVFENGHIFVFQGGEPHPFLTQDQNYQFRAIHDIYGHAKTGFEFGPRGELNATRAHAQMFSPAAIPALMTETVGQNAWVNFSETNTALPPEQRQFAQQKADLLPEALWTPLLADANQLRSQAAARTQNSFAYKGVKALDTLESIVGTPSRLKARIVNEVAGGTGVTRFGHAMDAIELSIKALDIDSLAAHEGYHYLEQRVLNRDEKAIVQRAFKKGAVTHEMLVLRAQEYDRTNGTNITAEITANPREAHAYGFEFWRRGELTATSTLQRVFQKLMEVVQRIRNMVHGLGFQSHEDIFSAINAGKYAQREFTGFAEYAAPVMARGATTASTQAVQVNEDVPNEHWLKEQVDYAKSKPRSRFGVPYMGKITSSLRRIEIPVSMLSDIKGENGEQNNVRTDGLRRLTDELAENGLKNTGVPYIEIGYDGVPWVSEGNHRIMAAAALSWESMPAEVRYFDGGNRTARAGWSPQELVANAPAANESALFSQAAIIDDSLADMAIRERAGEIPRTQLNLRITEVIGDKSVPQDMRDKLFDPAIHELRAAGGSVKRFVAKNLLSGQNLSRQSAGYRNVFNVLTSYVQRKSVLIAHNVEGGLSTWLHGATKEDKVVVSAALLTRTENGWVEGSPEYQALMTGLTKEQRNMFDQATKMINETLDAEFAAEIPTYKKFLKDEVAFNEWLENRTVQVRQLKDHGYFPERRYGDHVIHGYVMGGDGKKITAYFSQHERKADALRELDELNRVAANEGLTFEYGERYKAEYDGSLSFNQFLSAASRHGVQLTQYEKERVGKALIAADSTRRNRIFHRKNIAGYSQDGMRILAEFGVTMANKIAYAELGESINDSLAGLQVDASFNNKGEVQVNTAGGTNVWAQDGEKAGFYRNMADETVEFVLNPRESSGVSSKMRGLATAHFLGGSFAAGMVNLTSLAMNTVPFLTQHTSYTDSVGKTLGAARVAIANFKGIRDINTLMDPKHKMEGIDEDSGGVAGLRHALQVAAQDGTILDTEIYQIMGLSRGQEYSMSGTVQKAIQVWMTPFRLSEQMNRMTTFIAAFKLAKQKDMDDTAAYKMAQDTVYSTQFRYDDANRPAAARGDWGSVLFMFKSYPIFVLETLGFLMKENPRSAAYMLGSLILVAGIQGLPFAEDIEDIIDTIAQRIFNEPFQSQRWVKNMIKTASEAVVGADLSSVMLHGMANTFTDLNFASRVGLGNLIPGTRIGAADADFKNIATEIMGPVASLATGVLAGADAMGRGEFVEAARKAMPLGAQNAIKGYQQWDKGFATDVTGRKLVDVGGWEAFWQMLGMSSNAMAQAYDKDGIMRRDQAFYSATQKAFQADIVKAIVDNDPAAVKEATDAVSAWNSLNPGMVMSISPKGTRTAVAQAGMALNERTLANMPRALRASSEEALGLDEE